MERSILETIGRELEAGRSVCQVVITDARGSTPRGPGTMMAVLADGRIEGTVGGGNVEYQAVRHARALLADGRCEMKEYRIESAPGEVSGSVCLFYKVFSPTERLYVFGAGHVGYRLYELARQLGFAVTMLDERDGFLPASRYPDAIRMDGPFDESIRALSFGPGSYVVVASSSHRSDEEILHALWQEDLTYIGMLGSERKVRAIRDNLLARGVEQAFFHRLCAPIGIPLGGRKPEEVALSILAQMVQVRARQDAAPEEA